MWGRISQYDGPSNNNKGRFTLWPSKSRAMIGENRLSLRNNWLKFKNAGKLPTILEDLKNILQFNKGKLGDLNM